jgi:hypothetical protein
MIFVEMTTKDLEYYVKLIDETGAGFKSTDSNFSRSSIVGKMPSNNIACCREIFRERKSQSIRQLFRIVGAWSINSVHSARQPLNGLFYLPRVIMMMENLVE